MDEIIKIFALGGLCESGKNLYVIEIDQDIFVIDAGLKYPELTNKGIDFIIPDHSYLKANEERVKGYIITHGHDDVLGAISYLVQAVPAPIYCGKITEHIIRRQNIRYSVNAALEFVTIQPTQSFKIAGRSFIAFQTAHSIWDSFGIIIDTKQGHIIYTSDYIFDYNSSKLFHTDLKMLSSFSAKDILCLMIDSTSAQFAGSASPQHRITPHIEQMFQETKERIFIALYANNLFGIMETIELALKYNKRIHFYSRDMQELIKEMRASHVINIPSEMIITNFEANQVYPDGVVVIVTGNGAKIFNALGDLSGGENAKQITIRSNDRVILGAPYVPGNEVMAINAINDVYRTGADVIDLKRRRIASMHPRSEDIKMLLSLLSPRYYMPVKGEFSQLIANAQLAVSLGYNHSNILVYDNGDVARFENRRLKVGSEKVQAGDLIVDGLGVGDVGSVVISDREKLANEGILIIGTAVNRAERVIASSIDIQTRGLVFVKDAESLIEQVTRVFDVTLREYLESSIRNLDFQAIKLEVKEKIARMVKKEIGKEPMILPVIIEL